MYYLDLVITLVLGFRILFTKPFHISRISFGGKVYNYCRIAFVFLLLLMIPYYLLVLENSGNIARRSINELLCDIVVYMYFFVYLGNFIKDRLQFNQSIHKVIMVYVVVYYVYYNINSFMMYGKVAHHAYYACLGLILLSNVLYKLLYTKIKTKSKLFYLSVAIILTVMPILAVLRGATMTTVLVYLIMLLFRRGKVINTLILISIILALFVIITSSGKFQDTFEDSNSYGYSRPEDMLTAYTGDDANRDVRFDWSTLAFDTFIQNPLIGSAYLFEFDPFGNSHYGGGYALHNYYAALLVDTGFLLGLFYIIILFKIILISIKSKAQNNAQIPKYLGWTVAIVSTNATNAFGHVWSVSLAMHIILAYAVLKIIDSRNPQVFQVR